MSAALYQDTVNIKDERKAKLVRNDKTGILVLLLYFWAGILAILCVKLIPSEPEWCQELRLGRE